MHVSEAFNAGIVTAILKTVSLSPNFEHILVVKSRAFDPIPKLDQIPINISIIQWRGSNLSELSASLRKIKRDYSPDLIHAHSSWAGLICRINFAKHRTVYSSHGYGFQRADLIFPLRILIFIIESLLLFRTNITFCYWPYEQYLAKRLIGPKRILMSPILLNVSQADLVDSREIHIPNRYHVVTIGRITKAKDPEFYIKTIEEIKRKIEDVKFSWIGDGSYDSKKKLEEAGVLITGWLDQNIAYKEIANADIAIFTSEWEAGPSTIFEAIASGIPVCARNFPSIRGIGLPVAATPEALAEMSVRYLKENKQKTNQSQRSLVSQFVLALDKCTVEDIYNSAMIRSNRWKR